MNRELLWRILQRIGVPPRLLKIVQGLHDGACGQVKIGRSYSEWFDLSLGLRQGAIFSPTFFNIYSGEMIRQMKVQFQNAGIKGVQIKFYRKGTILRIIECDEELEQASIFEIMFADDIEFVTGCAEELQQMLHIFDKIVTDFGGRINTSKTKVMMVVPKGAGNEMPQPQIYVKGVLLECVEEYKYLGTLETEDNMLDKEISVRCQKMKSAYNRYAREIFQGHLGIRIKVNLFNLMVVTNGLYGCQVWNLKDKHLRALEATFFSLIRRVFGRYKCDWSRVEIIQYAREHQLSIHPMEWRIAKLQLRYIAHEIRIPEDRVAQYPYTMLLRGENPRVRGRPEHKYADTIRRAA